MAVEQRRYEVTCMRGDESSRSSWVEERKARSRYLAEVRSGGWDYVCLVEFDGPAEWEVESWERSVPRKCS